MALIPRRKGKKPQVAGSGSAVARATKTGTTYVAGKTALAQIPRPDLDNELGSSIPVQIREVVPALSTAFQRQQTYARMMNDASVDVSVRVVKTPVLGAEFFMEPYSDEPLDQLVSEFVWENLAHGMSAPLLNSLEDVLHFYEDGYSILEKVYENREWSPSAKGGNTRVYTMLRKLGARPAATIKEIIYDDNGGPTEIVQNAQQADGTIVEKKLGIEKIMVFTFGKVGGDLTGKSILRTAYPHWYYKTHLYKIDAIQKERHALGVPRGTLGPAATSQDRTSMRNMLRNLRTNEEAFIMQTPNVLVDFAVLEGQIVDVMASAEHHSTMILMNVMAQFMALGTQQSGSGSRAVAGSGSDLFMKANKYVANKIAQTVNMYLIPELVVWNFPTSNFPTLKVRNIGETRDLQMFGAALANLFAQQAITPDPETENWVRNVFDMPNKLASNIVTSSPPVPGVDDQRAALPQQATPGNGSVQKGDIKPGAIKSGNVGKNPNAPS